MRLSAALRCVQAGRAPSTLSCARLSLLQADEGKAREKAANKARAAAEQATKEAEERAAQVGGLWAKYSKPAVG